MGWIRRKNGLGRIQNELIDEEMRRMCNKFIKENWDRKKSEEVIRG